MGFPQSAWGQTATAVHKYAGDPDGHVPGAIGDLCVDYSTPALYQCTSLPTGWTICAAGSGITSWGLESTTHFNHAGDPNTHVTSVRKGDLCIDTTTPALWMATAATATTWTRVGPEIVDVFPTVTGSGTPEGVVTAAVGASYVDTTNGAVWFKQSGAGDTGWVVGSNVTPLDIAGAPVPGFLVVSSTGDVYMICETATKAVLTDVAAINNSENRLAFNSAALDGGQYLTLQLGAAGSPLDWAWNVDGSTTFPGYTLFTYAGNPNTHLTALEAGDLCVDTATPALWQATAADNSHWVLIAGPATPPTLGIFLYGDGSDGAVLFTATPRTVTDAVVTPGTNVLTSATAAFTSADVGLVLDDIDTGSSFLPRGIRIASVTNGTTVVMSSNALNTAAPATPDTVVIGAKYLVPGSYSTVTIPTGATVRPTSPLNNDTSAAGTVTASVEFYIDGTVDLSGAPDRQFGTTTAGLPGYSWAAPIPGNGGAGSTVTVGDTAGGTSAAVAPANPIRQLPLVLNFEGIANLPAYAATGGGDGVNNGGNAGSSGIFWSIAAKSIVHGAHATYLLTGGAGGDGAGGNAGGGGGGGDGWWITASDTLTGAPTVVRGGGAAGHGVGTGADGTAGGIGFAVHYTPEAVIVV